MEATNNTGSNANEILKLAALILLVLAIIAIIMLALHFLWRQERDAASNPRRFGNPDVGLFSSHELNQMGDAILLTEIPTRPRAARRAPNTF
ncbi:hypothetical protein SMACR_08424 [Sordaria macrospora]|uniref:WGS project CABT00000000 data, contig 2.57 n=2 Tax=Sordaria macrospora TaxID=5147 RepID=F7WA44_SORMK|nr:uncharacterized protein SMAC_08424 [Sordaria macrospora k-hell]KAA8629338.1 hypothetical protein SMACR_08424 [Sordaria macrospora]KAH7625448.1 hypothetical protein B0T09DRAFT_412951 [Sordaria sp. MPI-SDFR-AT-0083]WPJ62576.1 hypothetical protein SMAC4_08424 [Sordaria macrospora]CCC14112.1 unnamed protein product [Sordaria macrospora k-hell]